jgi:hypothetical protein
MDSVTVEGRAAGQLLAEKELLAESVTRALYDEMPELTTRHGPVGREKCLQDLRFTIEHLIPAVDLGQPEMFASYVQWLDELLRARNVSTREVVRSLELTERIVRERFAIDEADTISRCIRAGLERLPNGGRPW